MHLSVVLAVESPRPAVSRHHALWSADFPQLQRTKTAIARPTCIDDLIAKKASGQPSWAVAAISQAFQCRGDLADPARIVINGIRRSSPATREIDTIPMSGNRERNQTESTSQLIRLSAGILIAAVVVIAGLIAGGIFDPKPIGDLVRTDHPGQFEQGTAGERFIELSPPWAPGQPPDRYSIRLRAALANGDADSGYGLALAGEESRLALAVSPLGYVTVQEETTAGQSGNHIPWSTWPHVRTGGETNEIWIDVAADERQSDISIMINRESLWHGEVAWRPRQIGLWLVVFDSPIQVEFSSLEWFVEPAGQ